MVKIIYSFCFPLKIFSKIAGVKSPILAATYAYLTEKTGLLTDIGEMLADILQDVARDMLDETKILHQIFLLLPKSIQSIITLITLIPDLDTTVIDFIDLNYFNETQRKATIGKPDASIASLF